MLQPLSKTQQEELERQLATLASGTVEIVPAPALAEKLAQSILTGRPLRVKLGLDPTAPDIHLGHTVVINKLRQFQELGHLVQLVIGDFTGRIGDPTGRSVARRQLSDAEVQQNARTYVEQYGKVLDIQRTELYTNSTWLAPLGFAEVERLSASYTLARMLEREDFKQRWQQNLPISLHEFFYPLMQGYDSVALQTDVELGGTDQTFNLLVGRHLQREYGQPEQVIITMPLLEGLDGVQKMSKSLGNYIGVSEPPADMYGKVMSIPDRLMPKYYQLTTGMDADSLNRLNRQLESGELHPRDAKMQLAHLLVERYHGPTAADGAREQFRTIFQQRALPADLPEFVWQSDNLEPSIIDLLVATGLADSRSAGRRLVEQGAVRVNEQRVPHPEQKVGVEAGTVVQVGRRRFIRLLSQGRRLP